MIVTVKQEAKNDISIDMQGFDIESIDVDKINLVEATKMDEALAQNKIYRAEVVLTNPVAGTDFATAILDNTNIKEYILHLTNKN